MTCIRPAADVDSAQRPKPASEDQILTISNSGCSCHKICSAMSKQEAIRRVEGFVVSRCYKWKPALVVSLIWFRTRFFCQPTRVRIEETCSNLSQFYTVVGVQMFFLFIHIHPASSEVAAHTTRQVFVVHSPPTSGSSQWGLPSSGISSSHDSQKKLLKRHFALLFDIICMFFPQNPSKPVCFIFSDFFGVFTILFSAKHRDVHVLRHKPVQNTIFYNVSDTLISHNPRSFSTASSSPPSLPVPDLSGRPVSVGCRASSRSVRPQPSAPNLKSQWALRASTARKNARRFAR